MSWEPSWECGGRCSPGVLLLLLLLFDLSGSAFVFYILGGWATVHGGHKELDATEHAPTSGFAWNLLANPYRWKEEEPLGLYGTISAGYRHKVKRSEALGSVWAWSQPQDWLQATREKTSEEGERWSWGSLSHISGASLRRSPAMGQTP